MPWQRDVAEVAMEVDPETGLLHYRTVVVKVPRQSGKTTLLDAVVVHRCLTWPDQGCLLMAQTRAMSRMHLIDGLADRRLARSATLNDRYSLRRGIGLERVTFDTGSYVDIAAVTKSAGHGLTLDLAGIDEIWSHDDYRTLLALQPTMVTRPNSQMWITSTEGTEESVALDHWTNLGRASIDDPTTDIAYFEWSKPEGVDPYDQAEWPRFMPALGHTMTPQAIEVTARGLTEPDFLRSFCNIRTANVDAVFGHGVWDACRQPEAEPSGLLHCSADISPDRERGCIVVCGNGVIEVIDDRPEPDWIAERVAELDATWGFHQVAIDNAGPGVTLISELQYRGIRVHPVNVTEMKAACGRFYDAVRSGRLAHRGQAVLDDAAAGVRQRALLDAWGWTRKGKAYVSPIVAATLAYWSYTEQPEGELWLY